MWLILNIRFCLGYFEAALKRITGCARWTTADGTVIDHLTASFNAAGTGAGIHAFPIDTRLHGRAFARDDAFGTTLWRCSNESFQA